MIPPIKLLIVFAAVLIAMPAMAQGLGTPPPATNQCWDTERAELRDKTSPTTTRKSGETAIGKDQSPGKASPPSGNAAGSGLPKNPNAIRPPGVTEC
jgi:hypothetical protein